MMGDRVVVELGGSARLYAVAAVVGIVWVLDAREQ